MSNFNANFVNAEAVLCRTRRNIAREMAASGSAEHADPSHDAQVASPETDPNENELVRRMLAAKRALSPYDILKMKLYIPLQGFETTYHEKLKQTLLHMDEAEYAQLHQLSMLSFSSRRADKISKRKRTEVLLALPPTKRFKSSALALSDLPGIACTDIVSWSPCDADINTLDHWFGCSELVLPTFGQAIRYASRLESPPSRG